MLREKKNKAERLPQQMQNRLTGRRIQIEGYQNEF